MIGTVSTDEKAELARANGCAHTIVTSRENIVERVKEITAGKGVSRGYDSVGEDTLMDSRSIACSRVARWSATEPLPARGGGLIAAGRQRLDLDDQAGHDALHPAPFTYAGDGLQSCSSTCWRAHRERASAGVCPDRGGTKPIAHWKRARLWGHGTCAMSCWGAKYWAGKTIAKSRAGAFPKAPAFSV